MLRYLLASTAALAIAAPAAAETISTKVTAPVRTSTVKNGAADAVTVSDKGSVVLTAGTAITMDSNHAVANGGALTIANASDSAGIVAVGGTSGDITNSGTITIDESYTPTDTDNDGDLDGPFALGGNRFGIRVDGAHTGNLSNSGTITIEGNDSAGIRLGGPLTGAFRHDGKTTVLGDRSVAVDAGAISGDVRLAGTVQAIGKDAIGARFSGDIGGAMVVQGAIASTGYRYTTAPSNTSKLDADDLLQGGSALIVEGNVAGGIILAIPPKDSDPNKADEDGDGIDDAKEGSAQITTVGAAPAFVIGATDRDIAIGPVAGTATKYGLQIDGSVLGAGLYSGVDGNGLLIGGRGGAVSIANGVSIAGSVAATSNGANATALRFGAGASAPVLQVSGKVEASGGNAATAFTTAVQVDQGASLPTLRNSGSIKATASGTSGNATAILDRSGTVTLIENSGSITAAGPAADSGRLLAIDLSANTTGATVRQTEVGTGFAAPAITGDIRFGSGNDALELADGTLKGMVTFGAGDNRFALSGDAAHTGNAVFGASADTLSLAGSSVYTGNVDFGGGADVMTLAGTSRFSGKISNSTGVAMNITGGTLDAAGSVNLASLSVAKDGTLLVTLDKDAGEGTLYNVSGTATFEKDATLALRLSDVTDAEGRYNVLQAGTLVGASGIKTTTPLVPFLFKATVATDTAANVLAVDVSRRTAQELGLNRSQSSAYNAAFAAIGADDKLEEVFLGITDGDVFRYSLGQMLPDHAGGAFEGVSLGTRAFASQLTAPSSPVYTVGGLDILVTAAGWTSDKDANSTARYDLGGFGFGASGEIDTSAGSFGVSVNWLWNQYDNGSDQNRVLSDTYELAAYWRGEWGGFSAFARGSVGMVDLSGRRSFHGQTEEGELTRDVISKWDGTMMSASGGVSWEGGSGKLFFRPSVTVDYLRLSEDGYTDKGGEGLNLTVENRKSDELAVNGGLALGFDFIGNGRSGLMGTARGPRNWLRLEAEGGWREIAGGSLGSTTARFGDGTPFTLDPEQTESGWYAKLRARGGSANYEINGEVGAEDRHGSTAMTLRGTLRMGF